MSRTEQQPCKECQASRQTAGLHRWFNSLGCIHCGARLIQQIGTYRIQPTVQKTAKEIVKSRRQVVLADMVAFGHNETAIRKLVDGPLCYEPITEKSRKKK